jgi:hypothetical protein
MIIEIVNDFYMLEGIISAIIVASIFIALRSKK